MRVHFAIMAECLEEQFVKEVKSLRFQLLKKYEERCCLFFEYNAHLATEEKEVLTKQLGFLSRQQEEELQVMLEDKSRKYSEFQQKITCVVGEIDMLERRFRAKFEALRWAPNLVLAVQELEETDGTQPPEPNGTADILNTAQVPSSEPAAGAPLPYDLATIALLRWALLQHLAGTQCSVTLKLFLLYVR